MRRSVRRRRRGSQFVEAALTLPLLVLSLALLLFLVRLDRIQESKMFDLAAETERTMLPNTVSYTVSVPLSAFGRQLRFREVLLARPFIGEEPIDGPLGGEALEEDGTAVWVFPRRGERYHKKECRIVTVYPFERILTASLKRIYEPCSNCRPGGLTIGTPVYVFATGDVYHRQSCASVTRYVVPMAEEQAYGKGYTPCSYCIRNGTEH
jgi:hypothetical protein